MKELKDLLPIETQGSIETVNARDLHEWLGSKRHFADWIKNRIEQYDFEDGRDYITFSQKNDKELNQGVIGRPSKDYHISISMAKELSMVENNEQGKQARKYFIECEKALQSAKAMTPQTFAQALRAYADEVEQRELMQKQRDEAVRLRACVSAGREGSLFSQVGTLSKQNENLKGQLGDNKTYKQVKAISWLSDVFDTSKKSTYSQIGKYLKKLSVAMGYDYKEIESTEYSNKIKAYHIDVIGEFRSMVEDNPAILLNIKK